MSAQTPDQSELIELLLDLTLDACSTGDDSAVLDSFAISAYADALRLLARLGHVEIEYDQGRRVIARLVDNPKGEE